MAIKKIEGWSKELIENYNHPYKKPIVLDSKLFEWAKEAYVKHILPNCISHLNNSGRVIDTNGAVLRTGEENQYLEGLLVIYDGKQLMKNAKKMITRKDEVLNDSVKVKSLDDFVSNVYKRGKDMANSKDRTLFYNHTDDEVRSAYAPLRNYYKGISETDLINNGLPDNFLSLDSRIGKDKIGKRTRAAMLTTAKHNVGAVIIKTSEYALGGKVCNFYGGKLIEEAFARYNAEKSTIEMVDRKYVPTADGIRLEKESVSTICELPREQKYRQVAAQDIMIKPHQLTQLVKMQPTYATSAPEQRLNA